MFKITEENIELINETIFFNTSNLLNEKSISRDKFLTYYTFFEFLCESKSEKLNMKDVKKFGEALRNTRVMLDYTPEMMPMVFNLEDTLEILESKER